MVHPELTFEDDADQLLATHEALAQCVMNDPEASASELSQVLLDELNTLRQSSRMLRERAETAGIAKDNFIATLSHELRTPLTPVLATLGAWERLPEFPDALRDDLEMVRRNVDLEARLIDDLLDLTRVAHGKLALNVEVLDARKLLESVVTMYRSEINAKQIDLVLGPQDERRYVLADPGRLQQAFWNLLKNAVKFSPERGRIEVSTRIDVPGQIQIMVRDEGIGIAPEMLARLFTPFEQESVDAIRHYGGLGLGLSITRKLIEAQGGSIAAQSEGKYRGATFVITLPCVEAPDEVGEFAGNSGDGASVERRCLRVLLVEDHVDTARVLARLLRRTGHEVTTAHSVADAVGALTAAPFDVLVSDIGLPDGTGLDLIRQVRGQHGLTLPAVALTGFGMEEDLARCREAGFDAHLTKPVNLVKLEETVQRVAAGAAGIECM
jgi:signal transduction histidine kinase/ActR/RegA family two-component response regulator